jgi:DNA-binding PadR family transcriptional regulator
MAFASPVVADDSGRTGEVVVAGPLGGELFEPKALFPCWLLLMLAEAPRHGYELVEIAREKGLSWGHPSSLYRALRRMEAEGLLRAEWDAGTHSAPARKVYDLTERGAASLDSCAERATRLTAFFEEYASRYQAARGRAE